jgi:ATP-dependent helicase/nuclease subunit B
MGSGVADSELKLPQLHVLPWARPLASSAAAWLAGNWSGQAALDLADTLIVVPTRQSARRLREALANHAATCGQAVFPPRVVQPEQILELSRPPDAPPVASRAATLLAWIWVLQAADLAEFRALFPVDPPQRHFSWALQLAEEFTRLQDALGEGGLRFSDVAPRAGADFGEAERWRQLAELEQRFDLALAQAGWLSMVAAQQAVAAAPALPRGVRRLVLLATPDPRPAVLRVVQQWIRQIDVVVVVYAAPEDRERFDSWGRPVPERWIDAPIDLGDFDRRVHVSVDPSAQADAVAEVIAAYRGREGTVALGCADAELVPRLAAAMAAAEVKPYLPQGALLRTHPLAGLLDALWAVVRDDGWEPVAALARHASILDWLRRVEPQFSIARWLEGLDDLYARHLPATFAAALQHARDGARAARYPERLGALERLARLTQSLRAGTFPAAWHAGLEEVYGGQILDTSRPEDEAFVEAAAAWRAAAAAVAEAAPHTLPAADACQLALRLFGATRQFGDKPSSAVDIDGWLELLFRTEPHLIVAGFNEGAVPEAITGHAFLPESLRERLGLKTNAQRFARDAWQLAALAACRARIGQVDIFLGKTSALGDPLRPSRLLFLCDEAELPRRVSGLFRELPPTAGNVPWQRAWRLRPPRERPPAHVRVTAFRDYLRCPFRFYLKHVLKLQAVETEKRELDPRDFGDLVHRVLERLGRDADWRDCTDERVLAKAFAGELDRLVAARYGSPLSLPLIVQVESARQRLAHAARVQADTRAQGWTIQHVEWPFPPEQLTLAGLGVRGTIDRIERHAETGAWRVLDYKTGETALAPVDAHLRGLRSSDPDQLPVAAMRLDEGARPRVWVDLQLPLYHWALSQTFGVTDVTLGYFNLPKAVGETAIHLWEDYTRDLHEAALSCATAAANAIAAGRFWPPTEDVRYDDYASLFHEGVAESVAWEERGA